MNGCPPGSRQHGIGQKKSSFGNFSNTGGNSMARQVTCVCGRDFHIGHSQTRVQCRQCGRWYDGEELGAVEVAGTVLQGREVARIEHKTGDRKVFRNNSHSRSQTNRQRPPCDPIGSMIRWFLV